MERCMSNVQPCKTSSKSLRKQTWAPFFVHCQRSVAMRIFFTEIGHIQLTTPTVTDSATRDIFFNDSIRQGRLRAIYMKFYWFRVRFRQGKFPVYWFSGEHNISEYLIKHHPTSHNCSKQSTYLVPKVESSKYACYMVPNDM